MQRAVKRYASASSLPTKQQQYKGCLYPRQDIPTLPVALGLPLIGVRCAAHLAKTAWRSLC